MPRHQANLLDSNTQAANRDGGPTSKEFSAATTQAVQEGKDHQVKEPQVRRGNHHRHRPQQALLLDP